MHGERSEREERARQSLCSSISREKGFIADPALQIGLPDGLLSPYDLAVC